MGEPCSTPDTEHGIGKFYKTCLDLYNLEKTKENSAYIKRSVLEKTPKGKIVVCCPELGPRCKSQREEALGTCIPLQECKQLFAMFSKKPMSPKTRKFLRNSQCGYIDNKPQVCCSDQDKGEDVFIPPVVEDTTTTTTTEVPQKRDEKTERLLQLIEETKGLLPSAPDCGTQMEDKIFAGKIAGVTEFSWVVLLQYRKRA